MPHYVAAEVVTRTFNLNLDPQCPRRRASPASRRQTPVKAHARPPSARDRRGPYAGIMNRDDRSGSDAWILCGTEFSTAVHRSRCSSRYLSKAESRLVSAKDSQTSSSGACHMTRNRAAGMLPRRHVGSIRVAAADASTCAPCSPRAGTCVQ
jgi:hypothetical protein